MPNLYKNEQSSSSREKGQLKSQGQNWSGQGRSTSLDDGEGHDRSAQPAEEHVSADGDEVSLRVHHQRHLHHIHQCVSQSAPQLRPKEHHPAVGAREPVGVWSQTGRSRRL